MSMVQSILIRNGRIVDGSGNPWFREDVSIEDGRIARIGRSSVQPDRIIDAEGLVVCPGFANVHGHSDSTLLINPKAESLVKQGVTTDVTGNCGYSLAPVRNETRKLLTDNFPFPMGDLEVTWGSFSEYLAELERRQPSLNVASLVGHGTVRIAAMGLESRLPTDLELEEMKALVAEAMADGAFGLSSGLAYPPGFFAEAVELVELCRIAARYGGFYATHVRGETDGGYLKALREAIETGRQARIPVQISHMETHYPAWGKSRETLRLLDEARETGIDVTCDVPPYVWAYTALYALLPDWMHEGGAERLLGRLMNTEDRERATREMRELPAKTSLKALVKDAKWEKIVVSACARRPSLEGKNLAEVARLLGRGPVEAVFSLLSLGTPFPTVMMEIHSEDDLRTLLEHRASMVETDFYAGPVAGGRAHPRGYGTFPMIFRKYVRGETREEMPVEKGQRLLGLEDAVRKMTSLPMQRLGIWDRGLVREGLWADLTVFNPRAIVDKATYEKPEQYPEGIEYVLINGQVVAEHGEYVGLRAGKVLRKQ